jgi:ferredoxin
MKHLVTVAASGEQFRCGEEQHLLQGMQTFRIGEPLLKVIPVGCRGGGCGVCRIRVLSGDYEARKMSRKHITEKEQAAGIVLACRIFPRSALEIEVLPIEQNSTGADKAGGES